MNYKEIDYQDSKALWQFTLDQIELAEDYAGARQEYASALRHLKLHLAVAYRDGTLEKKIAEDKAYVALASNQSCCESALKTLLEKEGEYKGREKVLEARASAISFNQSLIKNEPRRV